MISIRMQAISPCWECCSSSLADLSTPITAITSLQSTLATIKLLSITMAGTVKHILLLKFKDSVTPDQQSSLIQKYAALPNSISAMKGFEWGTDMSVENMHQGFTHVFISTFDTPEGRDEYLVHPVHEAFSKELLVALDNALVVDFNPKIILKAS